MLSKFLPCSSPTLEVWGESLPLKTEAKKVVEHFSLLLVQCYQFTILAHWRAAGRGRGHPFFDLPVLVDIPVEALIISLCKFYFAKFYSSCVLAFLILSLHKRAVSLYSSQDTCPCFCCPCISILPFSLTRRS